MLIAAIAAVWLATGAVAVVVMRHRGHDAFSWAVLFLFLGPIALPVAVSSDRHRPAPPLAASRDGGLDVLVAHDGSPEADAALAAALDLLGRQMTSLTLAAVVDLEAATTVRGRDTQRHAQECLDAAAQRAAASTPAPLDTVVLYGEPSQTLQRFAAEHGFELIVTGARPARRGPAGARRVAQHLIQGASVPVLVGPSSS